MAEVCPNCDRGSFDSIAHHWIASCEAPEFTDSQQSVIEAAIVSGAGFHRTGNSSGNYALEIVVDDWEVATSIEGLLEVHACSIDERSRVNSMDGQETEWVIRVRASNRLSELRERWVDDLGQRWLPDDFEISPRFARYWLYFAGERRTPPHLDHPAIVLELAGSMNRWTDFVRQFSESDGRFDARLWDGGVLIENTAKLFEYTGIQRAMPLSADNSTNSPITETDGLAKAHRTNPTETAIDAPRDEPLLPEEPMVDIHSVPHLNEVLTGFAQRLSALSQSMPADQQAGVAELSKDPREQRLDRLEADLEEVRDLFAFDEGNGDDDS
jgi:hypothetical protein